MKMGTHCNRFCSGITENVESIQCGMGYNRLINQVSTLFASKEDL